MRRIRRSEKLSLLIRPYFIGSMIFAERPAFFWAGSIFSKMGKIILIMILTIGINPASASLLFDGGFHADDKRNGDLGSSMGSFGAYNYWYCIPQEDSLMIIPAPGGRSGYALRIKAIPGASGDCGGNQHVVVSGKIKGIPSVHKEIWIGWSTMLDKTWYPQYSWEHFGFAIAGEGKVGINFVPNSGLYTDIGPNDNSIQVLNNVRYSMGKNALSSADHTKGIWHDWMFHVKFVKDNTGFVELYHKTASQTNYTLIYSIYNVATLNSSNLNPDYQFRIGIYRSSVSTSTQIFYSQGVKIGTTKEDVEFGSPSNIRAQNPFHDPYSLIVFPNPYPTPDPGTTPGGVASESAPMNFAIIIAALAMIWIIIAVYLKIRGNF